MEIRLAKTAIELSEVYRFRYSIYVLEMNRPQRYADHSQRSIRDSLDDFGHTLVAYEHGAIVGTLRIKFLRDGSVGEYDDFYGLGSLSEQQRVSTSITTRLMIAKEFRSGTLAVKLSKAVFQFAQQHAIQTDFIDCNPPLDKFFFRMGHKRVREISHPEYGDVVVMKLDLADQAYLRSIKSPFAKSRATASTPKGTKTYVLN
ncbi:hypothetical protein CKO51_12900 [Rhodopirellula sp. SM50]|nr:GNAT family N-acetyltransferase [Rhodopirellula sp. SM50]PAY19045.1 hypothetical protein CKO51_12900 [Rhodopirellula sp. SM50]